MKEYLLNLVFNNHRCNWNRKSRSDNYHFVAYSLCCPVLNPPIMVVWRFIHACNEPITQLNYRLNKSTTITLIIQEMNKKKKSVDCVQLFENCCAFFSDQSSPHTHSIDNTSRPTWAGSSLSSSKTVTVTEWLSISLNDWMANYTNYEEIPQNSEKYANHGSVPDRSAVGLLPKLLLSCLLVVRSD